MSLAFLPCIFHHDAHTVVPVIVVKVPQNPNARMIHFDDGRNPFRCPQPQNGNRGWIRHWISIERDDLEGMTGQGEAADLRRTSVEDMKENTLSLLYPDRFAMTEHPAVDGD